MRRRRDIPWELWLGCLAAAILAHAALVVPSTRALARSLDAGFEPKPIESEPIALDLLEPEPEEFVELDAANDRPPPDSKRIADRDSDVEHETKAPIGTPNPTSVAGSKPGDPSETSPTPDTVEPELEGSDADLHEAPDGQQPGPDSASDVAKTWGKLGGSPGVLHDSFGTSGRPDHVPDADPQHQNLLDSKEHLYASFFSRMRGRILEHWNVQKAIDRYDPRATQLGASPRTTVVKIRLDSSGAIDELIFEQESDVDYLDAEAIRALKAAGPFPNPPEGLFEDGVFEITVAFTVQPDGSAKVFRSSR